MPLLYTTNYLIGRKISTSEAGKTLIMAYQRVVFSFAKFVFSFYIVNMVSHRQLNIGAGVSILENLF